MSRFTKIYSRFKKPIYRYVAARVSDPEIAEDITQEIFIKVFRFEESYQKKYAFSTWLWAIAKNTVADSLRELRKAEIASDPITSEMPCGRQCAETLAIHKDERKRLLRILRPMTRLQKRVLWMRAVHHLSYIEIAKKLGMSAAAVKNMACRAKQNLLQNHSLVPVPL
jgi:RNA polymerase sigma-70 factor (ECF subfamily)